MILGTEEANRDAMLLSYHTQLPTVNSISSRMSFSESVKVNNFFAPEFIENNFQMKLEFLKVKAALEILLQSQHMEFLWE
jgi:hypothetical protein